MKVDLKIFRYDPETGERRYDTFRLELEEGMTFLRALQKIKEEIDPSLTFRQFCRAGICGTCTVYINGFPKLACKEPVLPYALTHETVVIEPLDKFPPIRDLAVEHDPILKDMKRFRTWIESFEGRPSIPPQVSRIIEKASDCILCYACQSYCPQVIEEDYAGPLLFAKIFRYAYDPRDKEGVARIREAMEKGKLFHCLSCDKCNNVCPKEVEPADLIRDLMTSTVGD